MNPLFMPELPEVETVVRGLREPLIGRTVRGMWHDSHAISAAKCAVYESIVSLSILQPNIIRELDIHALS